MPTFRKPFVIVTVAALASIGIAACGDDAEAPAAPTTEPTAAPTTAPERPTTSIPADDGGGDMQAGAPSFQSFTVSSPVPCQDGNASVEMAFTTTNAVSIEIQIGDGAFETTAGYGPNETGVFTSIPCSGAATSSITLKACTEDATCVPSATEPVEITA